MKFIDMVPHVAQYVPAVPDQLAVDHLVKAARRFCERTMAWHLTANTVTTLAGVDRYTLQLPNDSELSKLIRIEIGGYTYAVPNWHTGAMLYRDKSAYHAVIVGYNDVLISPMPAADLPLIADIAVQPTLRAQRWPDDLDRYVDLIAKRAGSTLLTLPNKEWKDAQQAVRLESEFDDETDTVKTRVAAGFGNSHQRRFVEWF